MKKILFVLIVLLTVVLTFACSKGSEEEAGGTKYQIEVELSENDAVITQRVDYINPHKDTLSELRFNLYPNAYARDAKNKAYKDSLLKYGSIELLEVKVNGTAVNTTLSATKHQVSVPLSGLNEGEKVEIFFRCLLSIPETRLRLGKYNGVFNMGNFYPILAVYENGSFRDDTFSIIGDPFYSDIADYEVTIRANKELFIAAGGDASVTVEGEQKTFKTTLENARDFAFCASRDFKVAEQTAGSVKVRYFYLKDKKPEEAVQTACNAIERFGKALVAYPYPTFTVVETYFDYGGMEYPALIYVSTTVADKKQVIIHETAHQWWYGMVGSDGFNEAYIDEGLATFFEGYYYILDGDRLRYNEHFKKLKTNYAAYYALNSKSENFSGALKRNLQSFTEKDYNALCYYRSAIMLHRAYEVLGSTGFEKALKILCEEHAYGKIDTESFINAFSRGYGKEVDGFFRSYIEGKVQDVFYTYSNNIVI